MDAYQNQHNLPNHHPKVQGRLDFSVVVITPRQTCLTSQIKVINTYLPLRGKFLANPQFVNLFKLKPAYKIQG